MQHVQLTVFSYAFTTFKYNPYCNQDVIAVCFMFHTLLNMTAGKRLSLVSFAIFTTNFSKIWYAGRSQKSGFIE